MSHHSEHTNEFELKEGLSSPTAIAINNDDALEKGLLLENQPTRKSSISSMDGPNSSPSALMPTRPDENIKPEDSAPVEPPKEIRPIRRDTRPISLDQRTLLQSPLEKGGIPPELPERIVGNAPQDAQSDIPANLDQYTAFWKAYNDDADAQDKEIVGSLSGDLDVLLIFAGLFSASNVAFIVEAYKDLKQDNVDTTNDLLRTTNDLLRTLIHNQVSPSNPIIAEISQFTTTPRAVRVNALFFTSLSCSLLTALGAVLGKQWLNHYKREGRRMSLAERGRERQTKYMGLERWHLEQVVETLPTLLQLSLFLFLGALIDFLWPINRTVAGVIAGFSIITFCFYVMTTTIAAFFPSAPFQTRFSALLQTARISFLVFLAWIQKSVLVVSLRLRCRTYWLGLSSFFARRTSRRSHTTASPIRSPMHTHSAQSVPDPNSSDNLGANVEQITPLPSVTIRGKISKVFSTIGRLLSRRSSSSPKGLLKNVGSILSKDDLSCECISWLLETSSVDKTLSLAATAALMLPERVWERIDTLDEIPHILRLVLGARSFESKVILDAQPGTVKAILEPLHGLIMEWDRESELVVPTLGDNKSFAIALENLLWRVVRTYPVEGAAAVQILKMLVKLGFSVEPHRHEVDLLYRSTLQVIAALASGRDMVLGFTVLLESPLSFEAMRNVLDLPSYWGASYLPGLLKCFHGSILMTDESRFIRTVHSSVRSFFADPIRCQNPNINTSTFRHTTLALNCVKLMTRELKHNILGTDNHLLLNNDISDLEMKLTSAGVSESLQYACQHWATHLQFSSRRDPELRDAVQDFCTSGLLPWLEVMSLLGCYDRTPFLIGCAETWISSVRSRNLSNVAVTLLQEMHRFIGLFKGSVKLSAAAIYSVCLPLTYPSALHTHYGDKMPSLRIYPGGRLSLWPSTSKIVPLYNGLALTAVAVSHDSKYILAGLQYGMVGLFTMSEGKPIAIFEAHKGLVQGVAFGPDNGTIISGSLDGTIKIWDINSRSVRHTLVDHREEAWSFGVSPDGRYIVSGGDDPTVHLWDASTGSHIAAMEGHSSAVSAVMISPDGHKILSASQDHTVRIWNMADQALLAKIDHSSYVTSAIFSSDGKLVAFGGGDDMLKIWDAASFSPVQIFKGHSDRISGLAFTLDSRFIASSSDDCIIRVWDVLDGSVQTVLEGHTDWINHISFTPDQKYIVSGSADGTVRTWNWKDTDSNSIKTTGVCTSWIIAITFSTDGKILASGGKNGEVHIWKVEDMTHIVGLDGHSESVESIAFSLDGKHVTASSKELTTIWDLDTYQVTSSPASSSLSHRDSSESAIGHEADEVTRISTVECRLSLGGDTVYAKQFSAGQEIKSKKLLKLPVPNISVSGTHRYLLAVGTKGGHIMTLDFSSIISFETIFDEEAARSEE